MEFKTEIKKELNQTKLKIIYPGSYKEDYQVRMIRENTIKGLTVMNVRGEEAETVCEYDITGLTSLKNQYRKKKITEKEMRDFLIQVQRVIEETEKYLLDPNRLLLEPEYIFGEENVYSFCYYPYGERQIRADFHRLMDDFVQWTDYQDVPSVKTAFLLHKETMKENYSLKKIIKKLDELQEEEKEKKDEKRRAVEENASPETEELWRPGEYDCMEHDWITRQELGSRILKETDNLWTPVKRLLRRHKRPKWGDWDGIYIDEEEL